MRSAFQQFAPRRPMIYLVRPSKAMGDDEMKSMYTILAETTAGFNDAQRKEVNPFNRRSRNLGSGASAETLVNIAESVSKDETLRKSQGIRRNNGASTYAESNPRAESDRILMEGLAKARPHSLGKLAELKETEGSRRASRRTRSSASS